MRIFIESDSVVSEKMSGIGHTTLAILTNLDMQIEESSDIVYAIVPFGKKKFVQKYGWKNIKVRQLPPGYRYINFALVRTSLPIPIDLWFGRGLYIFPNYKNWFVPFSHSITFIHDVVFRLFPETTNTENLIYLNKNFLRWLTRTDGIISISKQSSKEVAIAFPFIKDRIKTIYLGVDPNEYYPRSLAEVIVVLKKYGVSRDYFLSVGNIEPRKNILGLLEAYKLYSDSTIKPVQLVLVGGDGWKNEATLHRLEELVEQGYDIYRPNRYVEDRDLPMLYSGARAAINLAIHEGFGLPPVQAQATGTPVIVSDLPVFHETLSSVGCTFVKFDDYIAISRKMGAAMPFVAGRTSTLKSGLTWDNTVKQLLAYAGIISGNDR